MEQRSKYKTKQREVLLQYFQENSGVHLTAGDACEYLKSQGASIGQSTVYRQLESLVDEGILNKYIINSNSPACFEYVGADSHHDEGCCFHCKCEKCGKLIHLHCHELEEIQQHILSDHDFKINPMRTVFYGLCEECK
ncbi:MAG: transcriptional repressor [Lachnospiraceae bacterium]|nr:transcriptional repressor [Lachnospiraceae bacterium]